MSAIPFPMTPTVFTVFTTASASVISRITGAGFGYAPGVVEWLAAHADDYDITLVHGLWQYGGLAVWRAARKTIRACWLRNSL